MNDENEYVLGTDENELTRLGFQHQIWSEFAENAWNKAGFGIGDTLLDIGCGPGFTSLDLSRLVGNSGKVIALDLSHRFIKHLNRRIRARGLTNIKAKVANVEKLTLRKGSCDGAFVRWVLCFTRDPKAVIRGTVNALRKNGTFVLFDSPS